MKITYLGQAGLCFESGGVRVFVDPYLSDSVAKTVPENTRRQPIDETWLNCKPDIIVLTHAHGDHYDKETLNHYLSENSSVLVLSPQSVWQDVRKFGGRGNNYVLFNSGTEWTEKKLRFRAVRAEHSDSFSIGVVLFAEGKYYYVTGDTLYSEGVFASLPKVSFEAVFLPVNGVGNNMNFIDAERFVARIDTKYAVPLHVGMFDSLTAEDWDCPKKRIPQIYQEINIT